MKTLKNAYFVEPAILLLPGVHLELLYYNHVENLIQWHPLQWQKPGDLLDPERDVEWFHKSKVV